MEPECEQRDMRYVDLLSFLVFAFTLAFPGSTMHLS